MTPRMVLEGIYTPLITPFRSDGSFDLDALDALIERLIAAGVHGLISGGSTGENYAETVAERLELARFTVERARGRLPVIVGTGAVTSVEPSTPVDWPGAAGASGHTVLGYGWLRSHAERSGPSGLSGAGVGSADVRSWPSPGIGTHCPGVAGLSMKPSVQSASAGPGVGGQ